MEAAVTRTFQITRAVCAPIIDLRTANEPSTQTCANTSREHRPIVVIRTRPHFKIRRTSFPIRKIASMTNSVATSPSSATIRTCLMHACQFLKSTKSWRMGVCSATHIHRSKGLTKTCTIDQKAQVKWEQPWWNQGPLFLPSTPTSSSTIAFASHVTRSICELVCK